MKFVFFALLLLQADAFAQDYKPPVEMYFHTSDYTSFVCKNPHDAAVASLITHGMPIYGEPTDGEWLEKMKDQKSCWQLRPNIRFMSSGAIPVYVGSYGADWVTGIRSGTDPKVLGYIPTTQIEFIQLPTL